MMSDRKVATAIGALFLTVMISWSLGFWLIGDVIHAEDYLASTSSSSGRVFLGVVFELIDLAAVVGIIVLMFPIIRRYSERMALWYLSMRLLECVLLLIAILIPLALIALSDQFVAAGSPLGAGYEALGSFLISTREKNVYLVLSFFYGTAALVFFWFFYRSKLLPTAISITGLVAAVLVLAGIPMDFYDFEPGAYVGALMGLVELFLGVWLIVRGFERSSETIRGDMS